MASDGAEAAVGTVTCAEWIRRRDDDGLGPRLLVAFGRGATASSPSLLDLLAFDARTSALAFEPLMSPSQLL
jgi:prolactin regulatory element-binding protein